MKIVEKSYLQLSKHGIFSACQPIPTMTATQIKETIEAEKLDILCYAYSDAREYFDEMLADELENGDPVSFARNCMAAYRRAMLRSLQSICAPDEIIESVFAP